MTGSTHNSKKILLPSTNYATNARNTTSLQRLWQKHNKGKYIGIVCPQKLGKRKLNITHPNNDKLYFLRSSEKTRHVFKYLK